MNHTRPILTLLATLALGASACNFDQETCLAIAIYGMDITVVDDTTGLSVCTATVTATEGSFSETFETFGSPQCTYSGLLERAGTYDVEVTANGYVAETVRDVEIKDGKCSVQPKTFEVRLTPSP